MKWIDRVNRRRMVKKHIVTEDEIKEIVKFIKNKLFNSPEYKDMEENKK